jgi:hypothetical protein
LYFRTGIHCQNRHCVSEPGSQKSEKEQLRREIKEAEERQNRVEREMQANISRRGATRQGWAKIKAEAEKGNLHRGEKEARKQGSSKTLWGRKAFLRDMRK